MALSTSIGKSPASAADRPESLATYGKAKQFLEQHTTVVELSDDRGGRVAICPQWQGRVMTSTCDGASGPSFGFVHRSFIEAGRDNPQFNNHGAEDRMWLAPEGGPFSLWFKPGAKQTFENWFTPPALNQGAYDVTPNSDGSQCRMTRRMKLQNTAGTDFDLSVSRTVRLLQPAELQRAFGLAAADVLARPNVKVVAYETVNTITNAGPPMNKADGLISIWILSMLNAGPRSVIIVPYRAGDVDKLGPVVKSDYFGSIPPDRLKIIPEAILFKADAQYRSKIGTSQKRAKNILGAVDFQDGLLTLAQFTMPDDPTKADYLNGMWGVPQAEPYTGDVANAYNDGPVAPGERGMGDFCEIESLSPAVALKTGDSITHHHRTIHVKADPATLAELAKQTLGVDLNEVQQAMVEKQP